MSDAAASVAEFLSHVSKTPGVFVTQATARRINSEYRCRIVGKLYLPDSRNEQVEVYYVIPRPPESLVSDGASSPASGMLVVPPPRVAAPRTNLKGPTDEEEDDSTEDETQDEEYDEEEETDDADDFDDDADEDEDDSPAGAGRTSANRLAARLRALASRKAAWSFIKAHPMLLLVLAIILAAVGGLLSLHMDGQPSVRPPTDNDPPSTNPCGLFPATTLPATVK